MVPTTQLYMSKKNNKMENLKKQFHKKMSCPIEYMTQLFNNYTDHARIKNLIWHKCSNTVWKFIHLCRFSYAYFKRIYLLI